MSLERIRTFGELPLNQPFMQTKYIGVIARRPFEPQRPFTQSYEMPQNTPTKYWMLTGNLFSSSKSFVDQSTV